MAARGKHENRPKPNHAGPSGWRRYGLALSAHTPDQTCRTCGGAVLAGKWRAGVRRCDACRTAEPGRPNMAAPAPVQPASWWVRYATGERSSELEAEAARRHPSSVTARVVGPLVLSLGAQ
jgi:hypothetical protein